MLCANNPHQIGRILFKEKRKRKRRSKENLSEGQPNVLQHIRPTKRRKTNTDSIANGPTTTTGGSTVPTTANLTQRGRRQLRKQDSFDKAVLDARLLARSCYFKDDPLKRIDFVLVTTSEICADVVKYTEIKNFLKALIDVGVQLEIEFGVTFSEYFFIKVNIPDSCVTHLANLYHIDLSCVNEHYSNPSKPIFKFLETELSKYEHSKLLERAPESIAGTKPSKATNAERSMLLQTLMKEIRYSDSPHEFGLESLLTKGLFIAAYPLHEGPYTWTRKGPLSDRQLLGAYWANFSMIFKAQPLNLIEKYFGTELGMYFAWIEFYVSYLIPASIVGILSFILGSVNTYLTDGTHVTTEICESDKIMCPYCEHYSLCPFTPLKTECSYCRLGILLDNPSTVFFSMFMSVWATYFLVMWKRRLYILRMRWNVLNLSIEETIRQEFLQTATGMRFSKATGEMEAYIPNVKHCSQFVLTHATLMFCALLVFAVALSVIVYQYKMRYIAHVTKDTVVSRRASWTASATGSLFVVLSIMLFTVLYEKVSLWLTKKECPRTQQAFDRAFIVKNCILNFANNYAAITYLAFFKGKFFTYPGDTRQWDILGGIITDLCGPGGCLTDVGIQLVAILIVPSFFSCLVQLLRPYVMMKLKQHSNIYFRHDIPQWELDFYLEDTYKYVMFNEYRDLLIQYGYITCFVCALPVAPLLALIRNIFEIRIDASKFLKFHKRHVAAKVDGLGAYQDILEWITYVSVVTNACVIAFSSTFIPRLIYRLHNDSNLDGYINNTLSVFNTNDYERTPDANYTTNITICYYHGRRYPPDHPKKYSLRDDFFYQLLGQLAFVLVFEHVIVLIKVLLMSTIREVPRFVKARLRTQKIRMRDERMKLLSENYHKNYSSLFAKSVQLPQRN